MQPGTPGAPAPRFVIRDPVHGDIHLTAAEVDILDTEAVQRLRGIKQNGTGYLVYPGCVHTRFDHSLGVLAAARRMMFRLAANGFSVSRRQGQIVAAAALVHDISHIPFGHTLEDEAGLFDRHDRRQRLDVFLAGDELRGVLERWDLAGPVRALLTGRSHEEVLPWMVEIIASTVDADLLDYVRRDAYFAGIRQQYDHRIFDYFVITDDGHLAINLSRRGRLRPDARSEVMSLLRLRYFLTERVYFHHAKVAAGAMIARAVEFAVGEGLTEEQLYGHTDGSLLAMLAGGCSRSPIAGPGPRLVRAVGRRHLLKRAVVISAADGVGPGGSPEQSGGPWDSGSGGLSGSGPRGSDPWGPARGWAAPPPEELMKAFGGRGGARRRRRLERHLAEAAGLPDGSVVVHCPVGTMFKEVKVRVITPGGIMPLDEIGPPVDGEVAVLEQQYRDLWRFYIFAPADAAGAVRAAAAELLPAAAAEAAGT